MATFQITAPDGRKFRVTGADAQGAYAALQQHLGGQQQQAGTDQLYSPQPMAAPQTFSNQTQFGPRTDSFSGADPNAPSRLTSGILGAVDAGTFGFGDEIAAGLRTGFGMAGDYNAELAKKRATMQDAQQTNPGSYLAGELVGTLPTMAIPGGAAARGAGLGARVIRGAVTGAAYGGLYGAGSADGGIEDRLTSAGRSALVGGVVGGAAPAALSGLGAVANVATRPVRALFNPEAVAAQRVVGALARDSAGQPQRTVGMLQNAQQRGVPMIAADTGTTSQAVLRSAANTSPEARATIESALDARYQTQTERAVDLVRSFAPGGGNAPGIVDKIRAAARVANGKAYAQAYAQPITMTPEIAATLKTPAGAAALKDAQRLAANEGTKLTPGNLDTRGLDYVKRGLDDQISAARRAGQNEEVRALTGLRQKFLDAVDQQNPAYAKARSGAAQFFGAQDAAEAGANFVTSKVENGAARTALAKMSLPERQLFAEGFASDLVNRLREAGDRTSVINSVFLKSPAARERVQLALGQRAAVRLEAFLRVENVMDMTRRALGNSTTARQLAEIGLAGGAGFALGGANIYDPKSWLMAALAAGGRKGLYKLDAGVAERVGKMLASDDPQVIQNAIDLVAKNPALTGLIRHIEQRVGRVAALVPKSGGDPLALTAPGYAQPQAENPGGQQPQ